MAERNIPISDQRYPVRVPSVPATARPATGPLLDARGRKLHDLRLSVTDRCNFRCTYCMPKSVFDKDFEFLPHSALLSFEELARVVSIFVSLGVEKVRLTGGEPLLRKDVERLVAMLAALRTPAGAPVDLTLTTNGSILARKAKALREAGLRRATVSLDALDDAVFRAMNDVDFPVSDVLAGIDAATRAGLAPLKINVVVKRGVNDGQIVPLARHFRGTGHIVRFIEFMDVGASNGWRMDDVVPSAEVIRLVSEHFALEQAQPNYAGEVAQRWRYADGAGEIGVISSVTAPFCGSCSRARLSTEGRIYTCLFATTGHDLRALVRGSYSDDQVAAAIAQIWQGRGDRYSEIRSEATAGLRRIEMSYIGG
ncbi:MAG TPA: GTP 3',8-cyclase MoaA [Burkholderiaceae bacterium]